MAKCQLCSKKTNIGRTSQHHRGVASKRFRKRAKKVAKAFKPNIQKTTIVLGGLKMKLKVCTSCLKKIRNQSQAGQKKSVSSPQAEPVPAPKKSPEKKKKESSSVSQKKAKKIAKVSTSKK